MKNRWMGLCLALGLLWMVRPGAGAADYSTREILPNQVGHSFICIETIGTEIPVEWYDFTVTVMDEAGNRLEGVVLHLYPVLSDGSNGSAITGTNGQYMTDGDGEQHFRIPPPGGTFQLEATLAGYEDYNSGHFQITADGSMVVVLNKQEAQLPATGDQSRLYGYILVCLLSAGVVAASLMGELERRKREETQ